MEVGDDQRPVARPEQRAPGQRDEGVARKGQEGGRRHRAAMAPAGPRRHADRSRPRLSGPDMRWCGAGLLGRALPDKIGRASWREGRGREGWAMVGDGAVKKKNKK